MILFIFETHSANAALLKRLGGKGDVVAALNSPLRKRLLTVAKAKDPKLKQFSQIEGKLLYGLTESGELVGLLPQGRLVRVYRRIPPGMVDDTSSVISELDFKDVKELKDTFGHLHTHRRAAPTERYESKEAGAIGAASGSSKKAATPPTPPTRSVAASAPTGPRAQRHSGTRRLPAKANWGRLPIVIGSYDIGGHLTGAELAALALSNKRSRQITRKAQGISVAGNPLEPAATPGSVRTELHGMDLTGDALVFQPATEGATPMALTSGIQDFRTFLQYKGTLARRTTGDDAAAAASDVAGGTRAGGAAAAAAEAATDDVAEAVVETGDDAAKWTPQGRGTLTHVEFSGSTLLPADRFSRSQRISKGTFGTRNQHLAFDGTHSHSNGASYTGQTEMIDDQWRRVGVGEEFTADGHQLKGTFA